MKAIVLEDGAAAFRVRELPLPALRAGDIRIRVAAASFNPIDWQIRRAAASGKPPSHPILGRDVSGVVDAIANDVTGFAPGDEVYSYIGTLASSGSYAEYVSVPAELVSPKPRSLSHDQAAAVPVAGITAKMALAGLRADSTRSLFLAGASGGVGSFVLELARAMGLGRVVVSAGRSESRAYLVEHLGLPEAGIVDYRDPDFPAKAAARNGGPFDMALDLVGGKMLSACCQLVGMDGIAASAVEAPREEDVEWLFQRNASFHAVGANAYMLTDDRTAWSRYAAMLREFGRMYDSGAMRPPRVQSAGPLEARTVERAHELLERNAVVGKLVMSCEAACATT